MFLMSYKQTYQIMVISVKTIKFDALNKANKIIANLHNLVADIIMTLNFPLVLFRARGTAGLRGLEHPHFFAVIMFQIKEVKEI